MSIDKNSIISDLEQIDQSQEHQFREMKEGVKYGAEIDLEALEKLKTQENLATMIQKEENFTDLVLFQNFIRKMNIKLGDVVDKLFEKSQNYCIVVRDDKIIYANNSFLNLVDCDDYLSIYNKKFFKFIHRDDWDLLAENIGEMLMNNLDLQVRINTLKNIVVNVNFKAIYLQDGKHFSFVLYGNKIYSKKDISSILYDSNTGLPSYYLFEDRLQVAINTENRKKLELRNNIAVAAVYLDNLEKIRDKNMHALVLRKISEKLVLSLDKTYTVATGMENHFWVLFPNVKDDISLKNEIKKIMLVFEDTVNDGLDEHSIVASIGVSLYPKPAATFNRLLEISSRALKKAQKDGGNKVVFISE
ncbi:MAG: diguanylate cyclase domain-containing protein [Alphaproteobacteria bacterium]